MALEPGLPKTSPAHPCFPQTFPPREDWEQGTTADPCLLAFQYRCRGGFFQLAACSARGGRSQPLEARGKREESSLLGRKRGPGSPAEQKTGFGEDLNFALFLCAVRMTSLQAAFVGGVQPLSKLPVKEISQPLRAPRKLRLLLWGTHAGTPRGTRERDISHLWGLNCPSGAGSECQVSSERRDSSFPVGWCSDVMRALTF